MAARRNSPVDPHHVEPAWLHECDSSILILEPTPATPPRPTLWSPERSHVCEQRSARTQSSYLRTDSAHAELNFRVRLVRSLLFSWKVAQRTPENASIGSAANMATKPHVLN